MRYTYEIFCIQFYRTNVTMETLYHNIRVEKYTYGGNKFHYRAFSMKTRVILENEMAEITS